MSEQRNNTTKTEAPRVGLRPGGPGRGPMGGRMNAEKPKNAGKTFSRLARYIGKSRITLLLLLAPLEYHAACGEKPQQRRHRSGYARRSHGLRMAVAYEKYANDQQEKTPSRHGKCQISRTAA